MNLKVLIAWKMFTSVIYVGLKKSKIKIVVL
jgi:hypothetical protein